MLAATTRYPIAFDLSDGAVMCALQLAGRGGVPFVRAAAQRELEGARPGGPPSDEEILAFVADVMRQRAFHGRAVALLPPRDVVRSYPVQVEVAKEETFETALLRHASDVMDLPAEEMLFDYACVRSETVGRKGVCTALLTAARRSDILHYVELLRRAGGSLELVDSAASALVRVHALAPSNAGAALLCHVGRSNTALVVATRDAILAHRHVEWGTDRLSRKLQDNLKLGGAARDARFLLRKHGLLQAASYESAADPAAESATGQTIAGLLVPLADDLVHELHNLTAYIRSGRADVAFDALGVYGDGAEVAGLAAYFGGELNMDAQPMDPWLRVPPAVRRTGPGAGPAASALALGLALRRVRWL